MQQQLAIRVDVEPTPPLYGGHIKQADNSLCFYLSKIPLRKETIVVYLLGSYNLRPFTSE